MTKKDDYVRLIISDLHLGSAYSKEKNLLEMLERIEFDELILAGDIIEFLKKPIFTQETYAIFDHINRLNKKTIYIVGNHDDSLQSFVDKRINKIHFKKQYNFVYADRRYRIEHGDQYDNGLIKWRYIIEAISFVQNIIERTFHVDLTTWWAKKQIKKRKLKRIWDIVKWNDEADVFIMGHTHNPEVLIWVDKNENIKTYVNTGDWVDNCTYVLIKEGKVRLRSYNKED